MKTRCRSRRLDRAWFLEQQQKQSFHHEGTKVLVARKKADLGLNGSKKVVENQADSDRDKGVVTPGSCVGPCQGVEAANQEKETENRHAKGFGAP